MELSLLADFSGAISELIRVCLQQKENLHIAFRKKGAAFSSFDAS